MAQPQRTAAMASARMFAPRASLASHSRQLQLRRPYASLRMASSTTTAQSPPPPPPPKPRVLAQPERFNPPSHPSRLRSRRRAYPGPPLSEHERQAQRTRRYPHMMPPEGSLMYRILTSRMLHVYITMGILTSLVLGTWWLDFMHNSPDIELLPPNSMFFAHPITFIRRYIDVYWLYVEYTSAQTAEKRRRNVEDVAKRAEYKKAHGLDKNEGFGGWMAKTDEELAADRRAKMEASLIEASPVRDEVDTTSSTAITQGGEAVAGDVQDTYVDFEGRKQPVRKKWFGIW